MLLPFLQITLHMVNVEMNAENMTFTVTGTQPGYPSCPLAMLSITLDSIVASVMGSIPSCQLEDPGSSPGHGSY